jgi:hypothetical protein
MAGIISLEKVQILENFSLSRNTVAECRNNIAYDLRDHLKFNTKIFHTYTVALDASKYVENTAQLAVIVCGFVSDLLMTNFLN